MKKIFLPFLLTALMSMVGTKAFAHDIEVKNADGKTIYYIWANNKTELSVSYRGTSCTTYSNEYTGKVIIPKSVNYNGKTYRVTSIDWNAFEECSGLTSITIPNSVTSIGIQAFCKCSGLTSITIPNSVTDIGTYAFRFCSGLTSITVDSGNTRYDSRNNCNAIIETSTNSLIKGCKNTIIPNSVIHISQEAFYKCSGLTSITIPNSVTSIEGTAFSGCSGLTSITIPNSVKSIGEYAFSDCSGLTSITIPNSVTSIDSQAFSGTGWYNKQKKGILYLDNWLIGYKGNEPTGKIVVSEGTKGIANSAFESCSGLTSVAIPNSLTSIGESAFGWSGLTSITIPNSVTSIGLDAFHGCSDLTSITVESGNSVYDSRDNCNAIILTSSNTLVAGCKNTIIPNNVTSIGKEAFRACEGLTSLTIPNSVTTIGMSAFSYCSGLTSITIPNSVTNIESTAFYGCSGLTSITIPNSVASIGYSVFYGCSGLTSVTIPNSVTSIEYGAFSGCSALTSITIPNSVTSIDSKAFSGTGWYDSQPDGLVYAGKVAYEYKGTMPKNTFITIKDGTLGIGGSAFSGCRGLTTITIPNSVISIGPSAFYGCIGLTSVTIPNSVASIGYSAFYGCRGLTSVTIPNSVTSIGESAFTGCSGLTSITIPNSVTSIESKVFQYCSGLTSVTIPNSVVSINHYAFRYCDGLTSITIPNSVTSIGTGAFSGCSALTSVISLNDTPPTCYYYYGYSQFNNVDITNCVVWVPRGSANVYKEAGGWKDFQNIRELAFGDVNLDFEVDQNDLNAIVSHIMGNDPEGFYESLADLNGDDKVNAADVVELITILNIQDGLSMDWQTSYSNQVVSSLTCTLNNDGDKTIQLTKCELYCNQSLVSSANFKTTLASGRSKKCSFDDLASLSAKAGFSVVWHYTYNGEDYTYCCDLTD